MRLAMANPRSIRHSLRLILLACLILGLGPASDVRTVGEAAWRAAATRPGIAPEIELSVAAYAQQLAQAFDVERALEHVQVLCSPAFEGRRSGSRGAEAAAQYIASEFDRLGLKPLGDEGYFQAFVLPAGENASALASQATGRNVLGLLPGPNMEQSSRVLILGAHYDHLGVDADGELYAGANDNASGVAVLIEIARAMRSVGYVPDHSVLFAAWDGEEQNLLGSRHYVGNPVFPLANTIGMIQLDMVGLASEGFLHIEGTSNAVGHQLSSSAALFGVKTQGIEQGSGSDHVPFLEAGVPAALLIWDGAQVPYYHTPQDKPDTLQPERLREVGMIVTHAAVVLATHHDDAPQAWSGRAEDSIWVMRLPAPMWTSQAWGGVTKLITTEIASSPLRGSSQ
jgi:hypothetical protein